MSSFGEPAGEYSVFVSKDSFKFNAAHFIAFRGYRERLHGHNYQVSMKAWGEVQSDGYVVDFTHIKSIIQALCKEWNEHVIIPSNSDVLKITMINDNANVQLECEDGSLFSFPAKDCLILPIVHSSAEELAEHLVSWSCSCESISGVSIFHGLTVMSSQLLRTIAAFSEDHLSKDRKVKAVELSVAESPNQQASYYVTLPLSEAQKRKANGIRIEHSTIHPKPCLPDQS